MQQARFVQVNQVEKVSTQLTSIYLTSLETNIQTNIPTKI